MFVTVTAGGVAANAGCKRINDERRSNVRMDL
jgi:hypothetical protein